ncbi:MAG TPA: TadE family protein [Ramlibacter sp.]|nr:TadE family protein [Ramlibacter sp.]
MKANRASLHMQGSVLIEFTLSVVLLLAMMSATWRLGHLMWQDSIVTAASLDAANLVATTPAFEMLDADAADEITDRAEDMIEDAIEASGNTRGTINVSCAPAGCEATANPTRVRVEATAIIADSVFAYFGYDGFPMTVEMEVPYGGRSPTQ